MIDLSTIAGIAAGAAAAGSGRNLQLSGRKLAVVIAAVYGAIFGPMGVALLLNSRPVEDFFSQKRGESYARQFLSDRRQVQNQKSGEHSVVSLELYKPFISASFNQGADVQLIGNPRILSSTNSYDLGFINGLFANGVPSQGAEQQALKTHNFFALVDYDSQGEKLDVPYIVPITKGDVLNIKEMKSACQSVQDMQKSNEPCIVPPFDVLAVKETLVQDKAGNTYKAGNVIGYLPKPTFY